MKRWIIALLLICLPLCAAGADEAVEPWKQSAVSLLTEVYGYTAEEAASFTFTKTDTDTETVVTFAPKAHPEWAYTNRKNGKDSEDWISETPFSTQPPSSNYPGENSVRDFLRTARENGWFTNWNTESRAKAAAWMKEWSVRPNALLDAGLATGEIPAAKALNEFFVSCYGEEMTWTQALIQWRDEELASYGFTLEEETQIAPAQGIRRYHPLDGYFTAVTFSGEVPQEIQQALSHPKLEGWTCLCGAMQVYDHVNPENEVNGLGMIAFEKQGERLLASVYLDGAKNAWQLVPVSEKALLSGRKLSIVFDTLTGSYQLNYPISAKEYERFTVRPLIRFSENGALLCYCSLKEYRYVNEATGESILIDGEGQRMDSESFWYHVTTYEQGKAPQEKLYSKLMAPYADYLDARAFPKTAEECEKAEPCAYPEGYTPISGVHLRAKNTSHSDDLGMYAPGTLVRVLDKQKGDPYPWYHVKVGSLEGYMSSVYVDDPGSDCAMSPLHQQEPLMIAQARKEINLKKGTGWFDGTVSKLPAGTRMHVLATRGDWLHVMVPRGEIGWMMDVDGTDGYVRESDVVLGATTMQLDWKQ